MNELINSAYMHTYFPSSPNIQYGIYLAREGKDEKENHLKTIPKCIKRYKSIARKNKDLLTGTDDCVHSYENLKNNKF